MLWEHATQNAKFRAIKSALEDGLTYAQTAIRVGTTKSAISGFCFRRGIKVGKSYSTSKVRKSYHAPIHLSKEPPETDAWLPLEGSEPVPLVDLTGCRWPIGDRPPLLSCNIACGDRLYCTAHEMRSRR